MTAPEQPWERLCAARAGYSARLAAMQADGSWREQLRRALAAPRGRASALRILAECPVEWTMELVDDVAAAGVGPDGEPELVRRVLARLDPGWLALARPRR